MGLIAGILLRKNQDSKLNRDLDAMLAIQSHRDRQKPLSFVSGDFTFGGANSQNFMPELEKKKNFSIEDLSFGNIRVFVDGVVLELEKHGKFLNSKGVRIPVLSGSAVIAGMYKLLGLDFMRFLEGEFSCAVWDKEQKQLVIARDPFGHKPLHYYQDEHRFVFSSEIKGILAAGVEKNIDMVSLSDYLSLNAIPHPRTIFRGIKQVSPGYMAVVSRDNFDLKRYWQPEFKTRENITVEDAVGLVSEKISRSVKKRLVGEEPYCFLSGGIDSSALVSFAAEISDKPVNAVTIGFSEAEADELEYAKLMAKHVGAKHRHVVAEPDSFFAMLEKLVWHHDSPFTDTSAYPTYFAAKLAREYTDTILTGDGPDQAMAGSGHHVFALKNNFFQNRNAFTRKISGGLSGLLSSVAKIDNASFLSRLRRKLYRDSLDSVEALFDVRSFFPDPVKEKLCDKELWQIHKREHPYKHPVSWFEFVSGDDYINKYLYADMNFYVVDDLMIKVDRMCMAHNLETLSPFQDIELAGIVNALPGEYKLYQANGNITTKYLLKKVCEERFPLQILEKKKQGFGIPLEKWLRQEKGKYLKEILLDDKTLERGYFNKEALRKFVRDFIENKGDYYYPSPGGIVGLLTLELWHRKFMD